MVFNYQFTLFEYIAFEPGTFLLYLLTNSGPVCIDFDWLNLDSFALIEANVVLDMKIVKNAFLVVFIEKVISSGKF